MDVRTHPRQVSGDIAGSECSRPFHRARTGRLREGEWTRRKGSSQVCGGRPSENSGESWVEVRYQMNSRRITLAEHWRAYGSRKSRSQGSSRQLLWWIGAKKTRACNEVVPGEQRRRWAGQEEATESRTPAGTARRLVQPPFPSPSGEIPRRSNLLVHWHITLFLHKVYSHSVLLRPEALFYCWSTWVSVVKWRVVRHQLT